MERKEAIEIIKKNWPDSTFTMLREALETLIPELKESEDEGIRKELIAFVKSRLAGFPECDRFIDWLERQGERKSIDDLTQQEAMDIAVAKCFEQGEQKPVDKVEPKFKEGEWAVSNLDGKARQISEVHFDEYNSYYVVEGKSVNLEEYDRLHHLWSIADAKPGDLIYVSTEEKGVQAIFREYKNKTIFFHCYLCSDFAQGGYMPIGSVELAYPLQKTHYNRFFEKMHEAGYEWDSEKLELKKFKQKPAWSEEEEKKQNYLIALLQNSTMNNPALRSVNEGLEEWLKSIKERYTWKPSDEQMKALSIAMCGVDDPLFSLYQDLKKLREE